MMSWFYTVPLVDFTELDRQIAKLRELRDSYREANVKFYGKELAVLLND